MKLLRGIFKAVISLALLLVMLTAGVYIFVRAKYGIDLWNTVGQLKTISKSVDESEVCPDAFVAGDYTSMQTVVNASVDGLVGGDEEAGFTISFDTLPSEMTSIISLTDKQVGALADVVIKKYVNSKITIAGKDIAIVLKQIKFDTDENGVTAFNTVVRLDMTPFKKEMNKFPLKYLKKYVPQYMYVSSTVNVTKGTTAFSYHIEHNALAINKLSADKTEDLFKTLDKVLKIGDAETLNNKIGNIVIGSLVGSESQTGLAYSLKPIGATDYAFTKVGGVNNFVINK